MKIRKYKTTALGAVIGSACFTLQYGFLAYALNNLWIFLLCFLIAIPAGIYFGSKATKFIKDKIVHDKIIFKKEDTLKYVVYSLIAVNILIIGLFVAFIVSQNSPQSDDVFFKYMVYMHNILVGFVWGILLTASLFQYVWIHFWEKKNKIQLVEDKE